MRCLKNRILVTGGAGFIGTHLCKKPLTVGNSVQCIDIFLLVHRDLPISGKSPL